MGHMTQRSRAFLKHALAAVTMALSAVTGGLQAQVLSVTDGRATLASMGAPAPAAVPSAWPGEVVPTIRSDGARPAAPTSAAPAAAIMPPAQRPALPPNDFQRFVLETSGQALPLFGADLFERPNPYVPADNSPVSPDYRVGPDDELQVRAWGSVDVDVRAVVDRDGRIHIPRIGAISVAGIRSSQVEDVVRAAIGKYYREFQVSVTLGQLRGITVYVVGQARQPGSYKLSSQSTLVSALFASGGPNQNGSMRRIQVKRAGKAITELDLYQFLSRGDKGDDIRLQDGDTIVIPPARAFVAIGGKVAVPAVYEMAQGGDTIGALLALTGGLPVVADPKRAQLERLDPSRKPARSVEVFALDAEGLNKRVRPGDLLTVSSVVPEFGNTVSLRGNVAQSLRSPWREGMTVRDLIPSRGFLMSQASITRQNETMLDDEARRRARSGQFDSTAKPASDKAVGDTADTLAARIGKLVDEVNFEYAVVERVDTDRVSVKLIPFNLGKALDDAASPENLPLQPGDIVTVFSVNDVRVPQAKRQVFVRVEGEVHRPGIYQLAPGEGLPQLLDRAGGLTPDAYLFGAEFYREDVRRNQAAALQQLVNRLETQVQGRLSSAAANVSGAEAAGVAQLRLQAESEAQKQALQRLRELKPTGRIMLGLQGLDARKAQLPPLKLESQDRLVIPSRPDFVYVLGSVNTESALIWREGLNVKDYLDQSGLTGGADLDEMFVIRADGSVISAQRSSWFSSLERAAVLPGDVIVLPEKTNRESAWSVFTRNAKDITQIIYQFSLGAAAIKTLRE
jgi:protein involved in polysaccharide export with SLBB domain